MRAAWVVALFLASLCKSRAVLPTYSCFDPPHEGQTNPLGEGFEDIVEQECCEALIDEGDIAAGRLVYWDPVNCNHGPGVYGIAEGVLCRAHDTDGCRFCHESCDDYEGLCITCDDITSGLTAAPTASPTDYLYNTPSPATSESTAVPYSTFQPTLEPETRPPASAIESCPCVAGLSEVESEVLARRGKRMRCDPSCSDGSDLTWGVINCNYFDLGQECRACSDSCEESSDNMWFDSFGIICKPCSAIP